MGQNLDPSGTPGRPENTVNFKVFAVFLVAPQKIVHNVPNSVWEVPKRPPRGAQEQPGTPQERFQRLQDSPKSRQEPPEAPQERPKSRLTSASERPWQPNKANRASKSPPQASRKPFVELHGAMFHPPANNCDTLLTGRYDFQNCPVCKAYAGKRPASLHVLV